MPEDERLPTKRDALEIVVMQELNKKQKRAPIPRFFYRVYELGKEICKPAAIGAAIGYITTKDPEGAMIGAQHAALVASPLIAYRTILSNVREDKTTRKDLQKSQSAYKHPIGMPILGSIAIGGVYLTGTIAAALFGVPVDFSNMVSGGAVQGTYEGVKRAFRGKKLEKEVENELRTLTTNAEYDKEFSSLDAGEILSKEIRELRDPSKNYTPQ